MKHTLHPFLIVLAALFLVPMSMAQAKPGFVTVTSSNLQDASGNPLSNAIITFTPVDSTGRPMAFKAGDGGQVSGTPIAASVQGGAFILQIADTSVATPVPCYAVPVIDKASGNTLLASGYSCVQVTGTWCTRTNGTFTSCNFDNFPPTAPSAQVIAPDSALTVSGVNLGIRTVTSSTTLTGIDYTVLCDATGGQVVITLPPFPVVGQVVNIKKVDLTSNSCLVVAPTVGNFTANIDAGGNILITHPYSLIQLQASSITQWNLI